MGKEKDVKEAPKKKTGWGVTLLLVNEEQPPKKVLVKGEETLDLHGALAKILNELEKINEALLS